MRLSGSYSSLALRMWWPVVVLCTVLGVAGGVVSVKGAPWAATALLRVDVSTNPIQSQQIVSTALQLVDSDPVYARVVGESRAALNELRSRTTVGVRDAGAVLTVTVTAPTASQAELDADAFANQAVEFTRGIAQEQFTELTRLSGLALTEDGQLPDPEAEVQRRERVGTNLADGQDFALRSQTLVTRIGGVQSPRQLGVPANLAAPVGALVGALVGAIAALALGVRRRRVKRVGDLQAMLPGIRAYPVADQADGLVRVAARAAGLDHPLVAVLALRGSERHLNGTTREFERLLQEEGITWEPVDADDLRASASRAARLRWTGSTPSRPTPDLMLVGGYADQHTVAQVAARADIVVIVATSRVNRLGEVAALCAEFSDTQPTIILASDAAHRSDPDATPRREPDTARGTADRSEDRTPARASAGRQTVLPPFAGDGSAAPQRAHPAAPWTGHDAASPTTYLPVQAPPAGGPHPVRVPAVVSPRGASNGSSNGAGNGAGNGSGNGRSAGAAAPRTNGTAPVRGGEVGEAGEVGEVGEVGGPDAVTRIDPEATVVIAPVSVPGPQAAAAPRTDSTTATTGTTEAEPADAGSARPRPRPVPRPAPTAAGSAGTGAPAPEGGDAPDADTTPASDTTPAPAPDPGATPDGAADGTAAEEHDEVTGEPAGAPSSSTGSSAAESSPADDGAAPPTDDDAEAAPAAGSSPQTAR